MSEAPSTAVETARILYDHVCRLVDEDNAADDAFIGKVDKLMLVHAALLSGFVFGLQFFETAQSAGNWTRIVVVVSLPLAAVTVIGAFAIGIRCILLISHQVAGIERISSRLKSGEYREDEPAEVLRSLAMNQVVALEANRAIKRKRARWGLWLNRATFFGATLTAVFVFSTVGAALSNKWSGAHVGQPQPATRTPQALP